jgi:hypothetical protein
MDTRLYDTRIEISVTPIYHDEAPLIKISGFDQHWHDCLEVPRVFTFERRCSQGPCSFVIEFLNKKDSDTIPDQGLDKAITIDWISINGIRDQAFVWQGRYQPRYPEPWHSQQDPAPPETLQGHTYLGWNGQWKLEIEVPAFAWMHRTLDLGWIYD